MGKRSLSTTKSGKFMNPTDQARKVARRKELKKNKKQRDIVRTAVIKGIDPADIIEELEKIDDMEFNPANVDVNFTPQFSDKVLAEKRRKLFESYQRVVKMHEKLASQPSAPSPSNIVDEFGKPVMQYGELRRLWMTYMERRNRLMATYQAVKNAHNVTVNDIPLPDVGDVGNGEDLGDIPSSTDAIPLPHFMTGTGSGRGGILKSKQSRVCPGVPSVPIPKLEDYTNFVGMIDDDASDRKGGKKKSLRFEDESGRGDADGVLPPGEEVIKQVDKDIDKYMEEMEAIHRAEQLNLSEIKMPGPPPGMPPHPTIGRPPGPPTGLPPGFSSSTSSSGVFSAGPQLISRPTDVNPATLHHTAVQDAQHSRANTGVVKKAATIIEAKPQMRNLLSDVTRFVPTNVKLKSGGTSNRRPKMTEHSQRQSSTNNNVENTKKPPTTTTATASLSKDDAYAAFMAEMNSMMK